MTHRADKEDDPNINVKFRNFNIGHVIIMALMVVFGYGGLRFAGAAKDDTNGRIEGSHADTIRHIDSVVAPVADRVTKLESHEQAMDSKMDAIEIQLARLAQSIEDANSARAQKSFLIRPEQPK